MDDAGRAGTGTWDSINLGASRAWWATVAVSLFILPPGRLPPELAGGPSQSEWMGTAGGGEVDCTSA